MTIESRDLATIPDLVAERRGIDFRDYVMPALVRGIQDRIVRSSCRTGAEYRSRVGRDPEEMESLIAALVLPVTSFFRDPPVFDALERTVLPELVRRAGPRGLVRAWSAGAATGEEAWSVAMLMADVCERGPPFEVIASDIDARSITVAKAGRYAREAVESIPAKLRERHLSVGGADAIVVDHLRPLVHFSQHDIMASSLAPPDAVVASFDLICFRNVLIYFDRRLQQKALERLLSQIEPGGALVLGSVETLPSPVATNFGPWPGTDPRLRIFRREKTR